MRIVMSILAVVLAAFLLCVSNETQADPAVSITVVTAATAPATAPTTAPATAPATQAVAGEITLASADMKLTDAEMKELAGATGGKAILMDKESSKAAATVTLKKGKYKIIVYEMAPNASSDAIMVRMGVGAQERTYPPVMGKISPTNPIDFEATRDGRVSIEITPAETGMYIDHVVFQPVAD